MASYGIWDGVHNLILHLGFLVPTAPTSAPNTTAPLLLIICCWCSSYSCCSYCSLLLKISAPHYFCSLLFTAPAPACTSAAPQYSPSPGASSLPSAVSALQHHTMLILKSNKEEPSSRRGTDAEMHVLRC